MEFLEELGLSLGSQPEYSVGCLGVKQVGLPCGASKCYPDAFPLAVTLELDLVFKVNAEEGATLSVRNTEATSILSPFSRARLLADLVLGILHGGINTQVTYLVDLLVSTLKGMLICL